MYTQIICFFKSDFFIGVIASLLASIVYVFVIDKTISAVRKCFVNKKLKKIIGFNLSNKNKFFLILPELNLREDVINSNANDSGYPFKDINGNHIFSSGLTSKNDFLSAKYIQDKISYLISEYSIITTDKETFPVTNISYIAFGGTNFYTKNVIESENNKLYDIFSGGIRNKQSGEIYKSDNIFDYCVICKQIPSDSNVIQILAFGLGETGTTAAGYYFANNWKTISKRFNKNQFGILLRVKHGIVDSVKAIEFLEI
jgi:hypothetical protein